jgi:glutathione-regulated potassium-efflux system ancillary protein KefC/glutathione-regulated potassium-efflux system protein KefB
MIAAHPREVATWTALWIVLKAMVVFALGSWRKFPLPERTLFAVALAQGGEFAFVLFGQLGGLLTPDQVQVFTAAVVASMALTPILIGMTISKVMKRLECDVDQEAARDPDVVEDSEKENPVIVIGIGRFGQTLTRLLRANGIKSTVLDIDSEQIDIMGRLGLRAYFGNGAEPDLLRAAGLDHAKALVIAIDEPETTIKIVETIRPLYPDLPIFCRTYDRLHAYQLLPQGVKEVGVETSGSAIFLAIELLHELGISRTVAEHKALQFYHHNQKSIHTLSKKFKSEDRDTFIQMSRQLSEQIDAMIASDQSP